MTILVIGGTGEMGRRVVSQALATTSKMVRVLTRDPESRRSQQVIELDRERVQPHTGDLANAAEVDLAMRGVEWVFCNTDFFASRSVSEEIRQGHTALLAARDQGVDRFIYSSLDSAGALTNGRIPVPHYDAKAAVAAWITAHRSDEMMRRARDGWFTEHVTVLTTAPYFENLLLRMPPAHVVLPNGRAGLRFDLPLGTARYPLIALDDIAWFVGYAFSQWQSWGATDLAIIGDALTGHQIAAAVEAASGIPTTYRDLPLKVLERSIPDVGHDYAALGAFFQAYDLFSRSRDIEMLRGLHPQLKSLADWLPAVVGDWTMR